jgi:hypothetical protein
MESLCGASQSGMPSSSRFVGPFGDVRCGSRPEGTPPSGHATQPIAARSVATSLALPFGIVGIPQFFLKFLLDPCFQ